MKGRNHLEDLGVDEIIIIIILILKKYDKGTGQD
jgi:hypothetical protein